MFDDIIKKYDFDAIRRDLGIFIKTIEYPLDLQKIIPGIISCFGTYDDIENVGVDFAEKVTITFEDKTWIFPIGDKNV